MDDMVLAAMKKWPNVPDCVGWLGLDGRGDWWMRDARAQAAGPFAGPGRTVDSRGYRLEHAGLVAFIGRNYARDADGCWYFQNGPQRVFVELEVAPWVWRLSPDGCLCSHTGVAVQVEAVWLDERGRVWIDTDQGPGVLHSQDMLVAADLVEQGQWEPMSCESEAWLAKRGVVLSPLQHRGSHAKNRP